MRLSLMRTIRLCLSQLHAHNKIRGARIIQIVYLFILFYFILSINADVPHKDVKL